jgi:hypothetical protein
VQQPEPLRLERGREPADARDIATGSAQARNETILDGIVAAHEDDRNGAGRRLGRLRRSNSANRDDHRDLTANELGRQPR